MICKFVGIKSVIWYILPDIWFDTLFTNFDCIKYIMLMCVCMCDYSRRRIGSSFNAKVKEPKHAEWGRFTLTGLDLKVLTFSLTFHLAVLGRKMCREWSSLTATDFSTLIVVQQFLTKENISHARQLPYSPESFNKSTLTSNAQDFNTPRKFKSMQWGCCALYWNKDFHECFPQWKWNWINCISWEKNYFEGD